MQQLWQIGLGHILDILTYKQGSFVSIHGGSRLQHRQRHLEFQSQDISRKDFVKEVFLWLKQTFLINEKFKFVDKWWIVVLNNVI